MPVTVRTTGYWVREYCEQGFTINKLMSSVFSYLILHQSQVRIRGLIGLLNIILCISMSLFANNIRLGIDYRVPTSQTPTFQLCQPNQQRLLSGVKSFLKLFQLLENINFFLNYLLIFILCALMSCLHVYLCVDVLPACVLCEDVRSPGTGVKDSCKLPCGC